MGKIKKVTMFYMEGCPYCRAAQGWMDELFAQYPQFRKVELEKIEENENPELAEKYDYYYVPTFMWTEKKCTRRCLKADCRAGVRHGLAE